MKRTSRPGFRTGTAKLPGHPLPPAAGAPATSKGALCTSETHAPWGDASRNSQLHTAREEAQLTPHWPRSRSLVRRAKRAPSPARAQEAEGRGGPSAWLCGSSPWPRSTFPGRHPPQLRCLNKKAHLPRVGGRPTGRALPCWPLAAGGAGGLGEACSTCKRPPRYLWTNPQRP